MNWLAAMLAIGSTVAAGAARAEPTFDLFQKLCVDAAGDRAASLAAAEGLGWAPMPPAMTSALTKKNPSSTQQGTDIDGRFSATDKIRAVVVAHLNEIVPGQPVPADACAVVVTGADVEALKAQVAAYAAVPADPALTDVATETAFGWRDEGGKHVQLTAADFGRSKARRDMATLGFTGTGELVVVGLAIPSK